MQLRVAIVSTPRCGNTWLRHLVSAVWEIPQMAVHGAEDVDWPSLPDDVVLQLHWHRLDPMVERLRAERFRVVTLARHPLDVLISILHYAPRQPVTDRWLGREGGDESALHEATPRSAEFVDYACGPRADALLSVTVEWWNDPAAVALGYENLVAEPVATMRTLVEGIGVLPVRSLREAVENQRFENLQAAFTNEHIWKGRPGLWRRLMLADDARMVAARHAGVLSTLGYVVDPDESLSAADADRNWAAVV